jgi:orotidine-5'-phosphate decarboxylase
MGRIIKYDKSVIVACDVDDIDFFRKLVEQTYDLEGIGGYKIGAILTIRYGLPKLVEIVHEFTDLPIIYDHQKAMTDIPDLGKNFIKAVKEAGTDAIIGFPQSGPLTEEAWIKACKDRGLEVIIGGEMTHRKYKRSEGGYISDEALDEIYLSAAKLGVNNFVVPGNKVEKVAHYKSILKPMVKDDLTFFSPGFIAQGRLMSKIAKIVEHCHFIIGRAIYEAKDIRQTTKEIIKQVVLWK